MSKEVRTLRPYAALDRFERALAGATLHFGDWVCQAGSTLTVDVEPHTYGLREVKLEWAPNGGGIQQFRTNLIQAADELGTSADDISLTVVARTTFLKGAEIVFDLPLTRLGELEPLTILSQPPRANAFMAAHHGCVVDAYILVNKNLDEKPLRPWRKGSWLGHSPFRISTHRGPALFRLTPLTPDRRTELSLEAKTMRYFQMGDHNPLEEYGPQADKPTFYVDEGLLAQLNATSGTPMGVATQTQLAGDFLAAVVFHVSRQEEADIVSLDDIADSLLDRVLRVAAGPSPKPDQLKLLFQQVRDEPERVVARIEHVIDIGKHLIKGLAGDGQ